MKDNQEHSSHNKIIRANAPASSEDNYPRHGEEDWQGTTLTEDTALYLDTPLGWTEYDTYEHTSIPNEEKINRTQALQS